MIKIDESNLLAVCMPYQFHYVKKNANKYGKVLKKISEIRDGEKGLKQVGDVQCSALLYP